jgi:hypothetical protein
VLFFLLLVFSCNPTVLSAGTTRRIWLIDMYQLIWCLVCVMMGKRVCVPQKKEKEDDLVPCALIWLLCMVEELLAPFSS